MRWTAWIASLAALVALAAPIEQAEAAQYPRVNGFDCGYLISTGTPVVWQTYFYGERKDLFDNRSRFSASPCFPTEWQCKAWLYWAQTDWPEYMNFKPCRRGGGY